VPEGWRLTASLNAGDTLRLAFDPGATPLADIRFRMETLAGKTCEI